MADYRNPSSLAELSKPVTPDVVSYVDNGVAVVEHVRSLPYVDKERITLYGVSLSGDVIMPTASRLKVHAVILSTGAPICFLPSEKPGSSTRRRFGRTLNRFAARSSSLWGQPTASLTFTGRCTNALGGQVVSASGDL